MMSGERHNVYNYVKHKMTGFLARTIYYCYLYFVYYIAVVQPFLHCANAQCTGLAVKVGAVYLQGVSVSIFSSHN